MANVIWLNDADKSIGGKAQGLKRLSEIELNIPKTFVVQNPKNKDFADELNPFLKENADMPKAVRSSAMSEDRKAHSFAGQFETYLNVRGKEEIVKAINKCCKSADSDRVKKYSDSLSKEADRGISVIVQDMVDAQVSGVLFTADPLSGRRDRTVIDAVRGLGEDLVGGKKSGEHYVFSKSGNLLNKSSLSNDPILTEDNLKKLLSDSSKIKIYFKEPIDTEWAIDKAGNIFWLQARPITTLKDVHLNELDTEIKEEEIVTTRCNIGEMMPGHVTPLTWSVFGWAIELGMQDLFVKMGALKEILYSHRNILLFYNHMFINMTGLYDVAKHVLMARKEDADLSITGEVLKPYPIKTSNFFKRAFNLIRYVRYLNTADKRLTDLRILNDRFVINYDTDIETLYDQLVRGRDTLCQAYAHHYVTSGQSGYLHTTLVRILNGGKKEASSEDHRLIAGLLVNIEGIESADAVKSLEKLALAVFDEPETRKVFEKEENEHILNWLEENEDKAASKSFRNFISKHGHRCVREAELREKDWEENPSELISVLKAKLKLLQKGSKIISFKETYQNNLGETFKKAGFSKSLFLRIFLKKARKAVANRENTKSLCLIIQKKIKAGYLSLADKLVRDNLLGDRDQIFFLTHQEIGDLVRDRVDKWKQTAQERRILDKEFEKLEFKDIYYGPPEPIEAFNEPLEVNNELKGMPVSKGIVRGNVKIINSLSDACKLEPGDIMISSYTDVGWTPYFSIIGGLVTEIGSALSHGAVVAREYGIPCVVNVKGARRLLKDYEEIVLDGNKGILKRI